MAEPISTGSTATLAVTGVGALSLLPGVDPGTVLGAFAGAAVFVLNSGELGTIKKLGFLAASIVAGLLSAPLAAALIAKALPTNTEVSHAVGALVASTVVVKLLLALIRLADNSDRLFAALKGSADKGGKQP
ncbi:phage holin family protein [Ralstonia pickettii]|uniref:putative holin n=1 Tax=Ralstonia pickettii TaxID=329 RepID=UPI000D5E8F11|nr:putative holin [Ralstonia pickettii]NYS09559.1 phage holin family protein [Ralstonia pickettii]